MSEETPGEEWERLATNLRVEKALLEVLDVLEDLPVVVFKGGILTRLIYGDLRKRASADNDLWIEEPHGSSALERLLDKGYRPFPGLDARSAIRRYGQVALWPHGDLEGTSIDLHVEPFMGGLLDVDYRVVKQHLVELELHGRLVTTFDRPLAFCHQVAHFLQHRLERSHLKDIGAAWDAWNLEESTLRELARVTCSEPALEHAVHLAWATGHASNPPLPASTVRGRACRLIDRADGPELRPTRGRVLSLLLANPKRLPSATLRGVVLESDDRKSRYGPGSRLTQTFLRIAELFRRG